MSGSSHITSTKIVAFHIRSLCMLPVSHSPWFLCNDLLSIGLIAVHYRQKFIIKLAKALMTFGAPSHRIEKQLREMSRTLELELECIHLPSVVLISFKDDHCRSTETFMIRQVGDLTCSSPLFFSLSFLASHDSLAAWHWETYTKFIKSTEMSCTTRLARGRVSGVLMS